MVSTIRTPPPHPPLLKAAEMSVLRAAIDVNERLAEMPGALPDDAPLKLVRSKSGDVRPTLYWTWVQVVSTVEARLVRWATRRFMSEATARLAGRVAARTQLPDDVIIKSVVMGWVDPVTGDEKEVEITTS